MVRCSSQRRVPPTRVDRLWRCSAILLSSVVGVAVCRDVVSDALLHPIATATKTVGLGDDPLPESIAGGSLTTPTYNDNADAGEHRDISICLQLIVRDEEVNLRANLPLWQDVADCYVIGVDDRTTDGTVQAILDVLPDDKQRFVFLYTFEDFAQARNAVLRSTSHHFPEASHVLIADADWRPDLATFDISQVDFDHASFVFMVWDHSGHTTRLGGWLLRNNEHLRFKYRVHEVLDSSAASVEPSKLIGWEVRVVETDSSWHADLHGHSRTAERFLFDLKLLELDYQDHPLDLHTLYYLGITTFSYMETLIGKGVHEKTAELEALIANGMFYFRRAVDLYGEHPRVEFVWSSIRWLAYGYQYFIDDAVEAETWYRECIAYDPTRVDCTIFLSRLYLDGGNLDDAWKEAKVGLLYRSPAQRVLDYFYIYECFVPIQAAAVIYQRVSSASLGEDSLDGTLTLGSYLIQHHRLHCKHGVMVDTPEDIDRLEAWYKDTIESQGVDVAETRRVALQIEEPTLLGVLLSTWGTASKAMSYAQTPPASRLQGDPDGSTQLSEGALEPADDPHESENRNHAAAVETSSGPPFGITEAATAAGWKNAAKVPPGVEEGHAEKGNELLCADIGQEVMRRLRRDQPRSEEGGIDEEGYRTAHDGGVLAAVDVAQILEAMPMTTAAAWGQDGDRKRLFRVLIVGGGGGGTGGNTETGLGHEDLLRAVSLLVLPPLFSHTPYFDVTYVHPNRSVLEAAQALVADCPDQLGVNSGGSMRFIQSTLHQILDADMQELFDYVDVGGPLAAVVGNSEEGRRAGAGAGDVVLNANNLRRLGAKLSPGGCLRVWAFAKNPFTDAMFRATASSYDTSSRREEKPQTVASLGKFLRTAFGIGTTSHFGGHEEGSINETADTQMAEVPRQAAETHAEEDAWVRQVLVGGNTLGVVEIHEALSAAGFELSLMLGDSARYESEGARGKKKQHLSDLAGLMEGTSKWEVATLADVLEPSPLLVHQALATWQGS